MRFQPFISFTAAFVSTIITPFGAVDVGSCEEFAAVDRKTETEVTITNADFACAEYTRLSIRSDMVLDSTAGTVTFSNFSLKVYGSLIVVPDVVFTDITNVDKNGGAVKVDLSANVVFKGSAEFVNITTLPREVEQRIYRKGAALHSKGNVTFEKFALFENCYTAAQDGQQYDEEGNELYDASSGGGGAIYHHVKGTMTFLGGLNMTENTAFFYFDAGRGEGGAIYNRGDIVINGSAHFLRNGAQDGGAIFQERWASLVFNGHASFDDNSCHNLLGGAISNEGGEVTFNGRSSFYSNFASSTGDGGLGGAIYNSDGGIITFKGLTQITDNRAAAGGGIYNREVEPYNFQEIEGRAYKVPTLVLSNQTYFENNVAIGGEDRCPDIAYLRTEGLVCGP